MCTKIDSKTQTYRNPMRNSIPLNTLKLEERVIDALIASLLMCPCLHFQGSL